MEHTELAATPGLTATESKQMLENTELAATPGVTATESKQMLEIY